MPDANRVIDDHGELAGLSDDDHAQYGWRIPVGRAKVSGSAYYTVPGGDIRTFSSNGVNANTIRYTPFINWTTISILGTGLEVISTLAGASDVARMGIYAADSDWQPGALVSDLGTVGVGSVGVKLLTLGAALTLAPGRYLAAINSNATGVVTVRSYISNMCHGGANPAFGTNAFIGVARTTLAYGAMPATGPAYATIDYTSTGHVHHFLYLLG